MNNNVVYFIYHVPKCAGRTVERFIGQNFHENYIAPGRMGAPYRYFFSSIYVIPKSVSFSSIRFVSGHYFGESLAQEFPNKEIRRSIMLRDAIGFYISHYNFRMKRYTELGMQRFSFELFYNSRPRNPIAFFILTRVLEVHPLKTWLMSAQEKYDFICSRLDTFWHVSSFRDCDALITKLADENGVPADYTRANVVQDKVITEDQLSHDFRRRIIEENQIDQALWERYGARRAAKKITLADDRWANVANDLCRPYYILKYRLLRSISLVRSAKCKAASH